MADIRTNFIAGRMNKSVDERLVPQGEYVNALNVRLGSTEATEIGAVENSKGNTQLTFLEYNGNPLSNPPSNQDRTTFCLGTFEDGINETIYWFIHDSNNISSPTGKVDLIVSFDTNTNTTTYHVVSTSVLNFDPEFLVTGVNKIENLLFFTDDKNPPRTINVKRNYDDPVAGVDGIEEEDINVVVKPPGFEDSVGGNIPLPVPGVIPASFPGDENYMETRFLAFAYRYRYTDGGYSATSLFSKPSFQPRAFRFDLDNFNNAGMINRFNGANITFSTGSKRVTQVDLLYKESTSNVIYVIERYNKKDLGWANDVIQNLTFTNSKIFTTLGSDELLRQYDNVPRIAKAQTIQGNRLIYGNYVDGYDITNNNNQKIPIVYTTEHVVEEIGGVGFEPPVASQGIAYSVGSGTGNVSVPNSKLTFDLSVLDFPVLAGLTLNFDVNVDSATGVSGGNPKVTGPLGDSTFNNTGPFSLTWSFTATQTYNSMSDLVTSTQFQQPIGVTAQANYQPLIPVNLSNQGGTLTDRFNSAVIAPPSTPLQIINSSISSGCATPNPPATAICTQQGFGYGTTSTGFFIQLPAIQMYAETDTGGVITEQTSQVEYFKFNDFSSTGGYLLTADTYSLHSNRDYETGIVYMDNYGRASTVLVSNDNTIFVPSANSPDKNTCKVTLSNLPPYWADKYKFVMKPSEGTYQTIYSALYYEDPKDPSVFWFKLEGDNTSIAQTGMNLIVKVDTLGPVNTEVTCKILEIKAWGVDEFFPGAGNTTPSVAGLYMCIKPGGFNTAIADDATIAYGNKSSSSNSTNCNLSNSYDLNFPATSGSSGPYDLPAGSSVRVSIDNWRGQKGSNCGSRKYRFDETFTVSQDYPNFYLWWYGDNVDMTTGSVDGMSCTQHLNNGNGPYTSNGSVPSACFVTKLFCFTSGTDLFFRNRCGIPRCSSFWGDKRPGHVGTRIEVTRGGGLIVWETEPNEVDPNLFYDASDMYDIYVDPADSKRYHKSGLSASDVSQTASTNLEVTLAFANCFTFGNGVESFRITDSPATKSFLLGERVLAVSNQDFKEANRFAGLTYSGVFSGNANSNNLNEFNLGLVNYKDCETSFGPIQLLYSRETDILCLQEDRVSYVLASKNVITDSTGGGAIASVPQVLGTQIARIEEYGISFNPESFAAWGADMFFTDAKRSAVINLRGTSKGNDQMQIISESGMRSWFRDQFAEQLHTQKLGGFDPYMNEYVLNTNGRAIPFPKPDSPCGTTLTQTQATNPLSYQVNVGESVGTIDVPYTITSGSITVEVVWNGIVNTTGVVSSSGTLSFNKTAGTPNVVDVLVTPLATASYGVTVNCPPTNDLTVVRVVLSSSTSNGLFIHFEYNWSDGSNASPSVNNLASLDLTNPTEYLSQTGQASVGVFPYSGSSIKMASVKQGFDDFNFDPLTNKFRWLSSNTLYPNTAAGMSALLAANPAEITPITNPQTDMYQAVVATNAISMPVNNSYLYLVWDLREVNNASLCYSTTSPLDACCNCIPACTSGFFGPVQNTQALACTTNTTTPGSNNWSWNGTGSTPQIGEVVYTDLSCGVLGAPTAPSGYYITNIIATTGANDWVQLNNYGQVIGSGSC
tara:strand:- start:4296 stop:9104 length:4809 start_codon:yes stop_codon:yes gene_type:complete